MLLFLIFLIAAVGISNTMLLAVYERIREFGMMRALGMDDTALRAAIVFEAGAIGLLGSLAGLAAGAAATWWLVNRGIDLRALYGDVNLGYRVTGIFRGAWNPGIMLSAVLFGVAASMATALLPARRALRLTARRREVVYPRQVVWIDAEQFVTRRVEQFSRRGRALKRMVVSDYRAVGGKLIAVRLEMSDLMKRDSRTVFLIDAIEVDGAVDETLFSLEELTF